MTQSAAGKFNLQLRYNEPSRGAGAQWNGNISEQEYTGDNSGNRWFTYGYDRLNRMTTGLYNANNGEMGENVQYDKGGNTTGLSRGSFGNLGYTYLNNGQSNQLQNIGGYINASYGYDGNGNVNYDGRNGVNITYNYLNLPQSISGNQNLSYTYDATGRKLRKVSGNTTTDYVSGIQYTDGNMDFVQTEEGRALKNGALLVGICQSHPFSFGFPIPFKQKGKYKILGKRSTFVMAMLLFSGKNQCITNDCVNFAKAAF